MLRLRHRARSGGSAVLLCLAACTSGALEPTGDRSDAVDTRPARAAAHVRVVAANLTSGDEQSYDPGEGVRILQALAPDVVLLQEFNYRANTDDDLRGFVDLTFGRGFSFVRERGGQIPNGVVSRYPIVASGVWDDPETSSRSFAWARIDVPGERDLWAVSVHLLTGSSRERQAEARALVTRIKAEVPDPDYVVLGGDLNTGSRGEGCLRVLGEILRTTAPYPVDNSGEGDTNRTRNKPLDWVLADRDLDPREVPVAIGGASFPAGLVFDTRVFRPLDEVTPVRAADSAARNMQHMAVVRDFELPVERSAP